MRPPFLHLCPIFRLSSVRSDLAIRKLVFPASWVLVRKHGIGYLTVPRGPWNSIPFASTMPGPAMPSQLQEICFFISALTALISASIWPLLSWSVSGILLLLLMKCKAFNSTITGICWALSTARKTPKMEEAVDAILIGTEDPAFTGSSYVIVQKYLHDIGGWNSLPVEVQERIIGRKKLENTELDATVKPTYAHNALTTIIENGQEKKILRENRPFGRPGQGEFGTYFIGYARSPSTIEQMLENMFIGRPPGNYDRLLDFSRAVTGTLFFVPTGTFLDNLSANQPATVTSSSRSRGARLGTNHFAGARRFAWHRLSQRKLPMNNLHRELAPISDEAWAQIEEEASRTLKRYLAARRVVDLQGPAGTMLSAVGTGHTRTISGPGDSVLTRQREVKALVEVRVPFELDRQQIDDVERGANDSDWQPVKDAARKMAFTEDRAILEGYPAADIIGIRQGTSNPVMTLPAVVRGYPDAIAQALSQLRLVGVNGPYSVLLGADAYTKLAESSDNGYPILQHVRRLIETEIVWAPAIEGAVVLTTRGGDFDLHIGQDISIGYLSHSNSTVQLYLQETFTFLLLTTEASVTLIPGTAN